MSLICFVSLFGILSILSEVMLLFCGRNGVLFVKMILLFGFCMVMVGV